MKGVTEMLKKSIARGLSSYCISVTATVIACLITALCGAPHVCMPEFIDRVGNEWTASFLQPLLIGLIGFAFGAGSVLFEIEHWSFLKQGAVHLAITAAVWIVVELICFSPITPPVMLSFTLSAAGTYALTWSIQYLVWRSQVRRLNEKIHEKNGGNAA